MQHIVASKNYNSVLGPLVKQWHVSVQNIGKVITLN